MVAPSFKSMLLCAILPLASASALQPRQLMGPGRPWVSFDGEGHSTTYSRVTTTINGAATAVQTQPYSLTGTVYTLIDQAGATYTTSMNDPPPPRATDSNNGRGYFAVCLEGSNLNINPFCQPRNNADLYVDTPYYITWDRNSFSSDLGTNFRIQLLNVSRSGDTVINDDSVVFKTLDTDDSARLGQGYYVWTPSEDELNHNQDYQNMTIRLVFNSTSTGDIAYRTGATVAIKPADMMPRDAPSSSNSDDDDDHDDDDHDSGSGGGVPAAAIAVPIVVVVLALAGIAAFFLIRRRRREQAAAGAQNRGSSAFDNRASSGSAQFNQKHNADIELTTSPTSPRNNGGNVFQEEIERQNRERA